MDRLRTYAVLLTLFLTSCALSAQTGNEVPAQPKMLRFDFTPLIGYRTSVNYSVQPQAEGSDSRVVFDSSPSYGFSFGVRLDEDNLVEFRWARQDTHFRFENGALTSPRQRAVMNQFHLDFTHEYFFDDWPWARPFITGSVGATHVEGLDNSSFTRFSFGLATGVKLIANRHLSFRVQAAWLPVLVDPQVGAFVCGGGCVVRLSGQLSSQGEIAIGPTLRF